MSGLRAKVQNGRLILDEPTTLPEDTELELDVVDPGDELDDAERALLHASLNRGLDEAKAGKTVPAEEVIAELKRRS